MKKILKRKSYEIIFKLNHYSMKVTQNETMEKTENEEHAEEDVENDSNEEIKRVIMRWIGINLKLALIPY